MTNLSATPIRTGRTLVAIDAGTWNPFVATVKRAGFGIVQTSALPSSIAWNRVLDSRDVLIIDSLNVSILPVPINTATTLKLGSSVILEPEYVVHSLASMLQQRLINLAVMGIGALAARELWSRVKPAEPANLPQFQLDESRWTYGLQLTQANTSRARGAGVKVAILDTGLDAGHPAFAGRSIVRESLIAGETPHDGAGHGTHVSGTAVGPREAAGAIGIGVAPGALFHSYKVLSNQGSGTDATVLAGIERALGAGCDIASMSLGRAVSVGEPYSRIYENVFKRCLDRGMLIVAAAGNESQRPGWIAPVGSPANCPSALSVGAIDPSTSLAYFSCGKGVKIVAPGVDVFSSIPGPQRYARFSGTSMATPHVAGVAALFAEAMPNKRGRDLAVCVLGHARSLPLPQDDVGAGLVQAPQ